MKVWNMYLFSNMTILGIRVKFHGGSVKVNNISKHYPAASPLLLFQNIQPDDSFATWDARPSAIQRRPGVDNHHSTAVQDVF